MKRYYGDPPDQKRSFDQLLLDQAENYITDNTRCDTDSRKQALETIYKCFYNFLESVLSNNVEGETFHPLYKVLNEYALSVKEETDKETLSSALNLLDQLTTVNESICRYREYAYIFCYALAYKLKITSIV